MLFIRRVPLTSEQNPVPGELPNSEHFLDFLILSGCLAGVSITSRDLALCRRGTRATQGSFRDVF
jgi:hypothetical protein